MGKPNTLTIVATENYEEFAANLQKEIETDTGIRFGVVKHISSEQWRRSMRAVAQPLLVRASIRLWTHLNDRGYVDSTGKIQDILRAALRDGMLQLPEEFEGFGPKSREFYASSPEGSTSRMQTNVDPVSTCRGSPPQQRIYRPLGED